MPHDDPAQFGQEGVGGTPDGAVPDRLARDLARLHAPADPSVLSVPGDVDDHVRLLARHHLTQTGAGATVLSSRRNVEQARRRRLATIRLITVSGVAAVLTLTGLILPRLGLFAPPAPSLQPGSVARNTDPLSTITPGSGVAVQDINNDGVVDILDAQRLAYLLRTDGPRGEGNVEKNWDFNKDGKLDDADARFIAQHVVEVKKNGGAG